MPEYKTPGVYVEVQKGSPPIEPVGTSTAAFIGIVPDNVPMPVNPAGGTLKLTAGSLTDLKSKLTAAGASTSLVNAFNALQDQVFNTESAFIVAYKDAGNAVIGPATTAAATAVAAAAAQAAAASDAAAKATAATAVATAAVQAATAATAAALVKQYQAAFVDQASPKLRVAGVSGTPVTDAAGNATGEVAQPVPLTSFDQFLTKFGQVQKSTVVNGNSTLAHAVFGFFQNGGAKCYVARVTTFGGAGAVGPEVTASLKALAAINDISIVAAPGAPKETQNELMNHCEDLKYRFAVLDGKKEANDFSPGTVTDVQNSKFGAVYFPWITVSNLTLEAGDTPTVVLPPSGHVAGLIARVDIQQGVHYSPANETLRGALALKYYLSNADQGDLNIAGINVTRNFRGTIRVWGARTRAASVDKEFKYVSVQRTMSYIAQSIDEGTQFAVFKPNNQRLWDQIKRAVRGFLTIAWRDGALFGATPEQAFYVKCDEGTNPPEVRALGRVVIEVGVAIVQPAEFVIFRISQLAQATP